jgi:hypothetical protein
MSNKELNLLENVHFSDDSDGSDSEDSFCFPESLLAFDDIAVQQFFQSAFQPNPAGNAPVNTASYIDTTISSNSSSAPLENSKKRRRTEGAAAGGRAKLTLQQKYEILVLLEKGVKESNLNRAEIGRKYNVSRQTIAKIIQKREHIIRDYRNGVSLDSKRSHILTPAMRLLDDELVKFLIILVRNKAEDYNAAKAAANARGEMIEPMDRIVITRKEFIAEANAIAQRLGITTTNKENEVIVWKAKTTWFERFRERHKIAKEVIEDMKRVQGDGYYTSSGVSSSSLINDWSSTSSAAVFSHGSSYSPTSHFVYPTMTTSSSSSSSSSAFPFPTISEHYQY